MENKITVVNEEITVPKGYELYEILDLDDSEFEGESPIVTGEVRLKYERRKDPL